MYTATELEALMANMESDLVERKSSGVDVRKIRGTAHAPFDSRSAGAASIADLDMGFSRNRYPPAAIARDALERNDRAADDQLHSLRLLPGSACDP